MHDYVVQQSTAPEPIPMGFHTITPFLVVHGAEPLLDFIKSAFNGETTYMLKHGNGKVMHATARIGNSILMVCDADENFAAMPCMLYLYVKDVDELYAQALQAGAESLRAPQDEFYGDRSAGIRDRWNNQWWIATHIEDVDKDEISRRAQVYYNKN